MKMTTEVKLKRALTHMYKLVIQWYKEHPEGRRDSTKEIDYYGSATFGIRTFDGEQIPHKIVHITLNSGERYIDVESPLNHKEVEDEQLYSNPCK